MPLTRRTAWLAGALVAATMLPAAGYAWFDHGLIERRARVVKHLGPYGDELERIPPAGDWDSPRHPPRRPYSGPGWYPRHSPDGHFVAVTTSFTDRAPRLLKNVVAAVPIALLGLVVDAPFYHTVNVWDAGAQRLVPVVTIKEADPHSGIAHRYAWSSDSNALLIYGRGRLPENYDESVPLCLIYLPRQDELHMLSSCPDF